MKTSGVYICNVCGKITNSVSHAKDHAVTHKTAKAYTCEHCKKSFKTKDSLKSHLTKYCKVVVQFRVRKLSI